MLRAELVHKDSSCAMQHNCLHRMCSLEHNCKQHLGGKVAAALLTACCAMHATEHAIRAAAGSAVQDMRLALAACPDEYSATTRQGPWCQ